MDKKARQAEKVRNFGHTYSTRMRMSDAKPYTMTEFLEDGRTTRDEWPIARLRVTVEALERVTRERDGLVEEARWLKLALEQHAARLDVTRSERDALKAALRQVADGLAADGYVASAGAEEVDGLFYLERLAREALGEVEP